MKDKWIQGFTDFRGIFTTRGLSSMDSRSAGKKGFVAVSANMEMINFRHILHLTKFLFPMVYKFLP